LHHETDDLLFFVHEIQRVHDYWRQH
jgi:hypothetical protein